MRLYADDALMYLPTDNIYDSLFQLDIGGLVLRAQDNEMSFNAKKCYSMYFSKRPKSGKEHLLGGDILERVNSFKYLGIFLSEGLTFYLPSGRSSASKLSGL